ncbi:G-protein coupled receptor 55-like [Carassius gibelio]|uniref:G-protein coupled receptor 55-like n=1 Tax=Carassius gibelio TaxID=101364 RepID=UPI0022774971|nr:G-protein coupled receptor 55-like [Carassius gibelio]
MVVHNCSVALNHTEPALKRFECVAYIIVFIVGLSFNIMALCIFCRLKRWSDMHIYMFNLLAADFLAIIFLPFRIWEAFEKIELSGLCTFLLCAQFSNMYSSIFTITAISFHRFIAVRFPFLIKALASKSKTIAITKCIFIWVIIIVICVIILEELTTDKLETCFEREMSKKLQTHSILLLEILGYLIPVLTVIFCSSRTIYILVRSLGNVQGRDRVERKTITAVITANMFTFIFCFTPIHIGLLLQYFLDYSCKHFVHVFFDVATFIAITNCCLDSIGYYFLLRRVHKINKRSS